MQADLEEWQREFDELLVRDEPAAAARCLALSERLGDSPDPQVRLDVAGVLFGCARVFARRGNGDVAIEIAEELRSRFGADSVLRVRAQAMAALALIAELQQRAGRRDAALAAYDEALSLMADSEDAVRAGIVTALLLTKAKFLANDERRNEAIVVVDSALSAIRAATNGQPVVRARQAAEAVIAKLDYLSADGRYAEAHDLGRQLSDVLGEVLVGSLSDAPLTPPTASQASLAQALAEIVNGEGPWAAFEGTQTIAASESAAQAVRLYEISNPWAVALDEPAAVSAAAAIVRSVADGYALLAKSWSAAEHRSLPLPQRAEAERAQLLRAQEVDVWAQQQDHPLHLKPYELKVPHAASGLPVSGREIDADVVQTATIRSAMRCLYVYELTSILTQSEPGLEALRTAKFRLLSISYLQFAMGWMRQLGGIRTPSPRTEVAVVCWLIAEGFFEITHHPADSPAELFPPQASLRRLLHQTEAYAWLTEQDLTLPDWTQKHGRCGPP